RDDQLLVRDTVRDFVASRIAPNAAAWSEACEFPRELVGEMAQLGLTGLAVPTELGGAGVDAVTVALVMEELGAGDGSIALSLAGFAVVIVGGEERTLTAFGVRAGTPGFRPGKREKKMGLLASDTSQLVLEECRVSADDRIGDEGRAFADVKRVLDRGRVGIG